MAPKQKSKPRHSKAGTKLNLVKTTKSILLLRTNHISRQSQNTADDIIYPVGIYSCKLVNYAYKLLRVFSKLSAVTRGTNIPLIFKGLNCKKFLLEFVIYFASRMQEYHSK